MRCNQDEEANRFFMGDIANQVKAEFVEAVRRQIETATAPAELWRPYLGKGCRTTPGIQKEFPAPTGKCRVPPDKGLLKVDAAGCIRELQDGAPVANRERKLRPFGGTHREIRRQPRNCSPQ